MNTLDSGNRKWFTSVAILYISSVTLFLYVPSLLVGFFSLDLDSSVGLPFGGFSLKWWGLSRSKSDRRQSSLK